MSEVVCGDNDSKGLDLRCQAVRNKERRDTYTDLAERFKATLNEKQRKAFSSLSELEVNVYWGVQEEGIAIGLLLAKELRTFLDHPETAYKAHREAYGKLWGGCEDIEALEEYFKEVA